MDRKRKPGEHDVHLADPVEAGFNGFASQQELPLLYRSARIFLPSTRSDEQAGQS